MWAYTKFLCLTLSLYNQFQNSQMRLKQRVWSEKVFNFFLYLYISQSEEQYFENLAQLYPLLSWTCNYIPLLDTSAMLDYRYTEFSGYFWEYYLDSKGIQHIKWVANRRVKNARIMYHFKLEHFMSHKLWHVDIKRCRKCTWNRPSNIL